MDSSENSCPKKVGSNSFHKDMYSQNGYFFSGGGGQYLVIDLSNDILPGSCKMSASKGI